MALPDKVTPLKVTVLAVPTLASSKVGALLVTVRLSPANKPFKIRLPVAEVLALYTLLLAAVVKLTAPGVGVTPGAFWTIWYGLITRLLLTTVIA